MTISATKLGLVLGYAARGWHVFPIYYPIYDDDGTTIICSCGKRGCGNIGKHPVPSNGFYSATTDEAQIQRWFTADPDYNWAVRTGITSGVVVLDVDPRNGGEESLHDLEGKHGALPGTITTLTGSGGAHYWFQHPGGHIPGTHGTLGSGLDVQADGNYVVVPPSMHMLKHSYRWDAGYAPEGPLAIELAPLPAWIAQTARDSRTYEVGGFEAPEKIAEGGRDNTLTQIAGAMRRYGLTTPEIEAALHVANQQRCEPPLEREAIRRIAWSIGQRPAEEMIEAPLETAAPEVRSSGTLPFPIDALPEVVRAFSIEWAQLLHSIPEIVAIPMLATASAAIGNSRTIRVNARYSESSCLWMATIAPPGSAKSAAASQSKLPLSAEESRLRALWRKEREDVAFRNRRKGKNESLEDLPTEPRYLTKNVTLEKLMMIHSENQRGLGVFNDELGSFIGSFDQYRSRGQGADRQNWLSIWDGDDITVDRIREGGSFYVEKALVSVFGTIQPDLLKTLTGEVGNDGFLARFLFTYIPRLPLAGADDPSPDSAVVDWWHRTIKDVLAWQIPTLTPFTPLGSKTFRELSWKWAREGDSPETDPRLLDFYAKGVRHAARLALVLHCIREASGEVDEPLVDEVTAENTWALMRYFASTMRYVVLKVEEGETGKLVDQVVEFAKKHNGRVTIRDAQRSRVAGIRGAEEMAKAFKQVENYGFGKVSTETVGGVRRVWLALNEE